MAPLLYCAEGVGFAPNRILPKSGLERRNLLTNRHIPITMRLVIIEITNIIVGEFIPKSLTHDIES